MSIHIVSVLASPHGSCSTAAAVAGVLAGVTAAGARTDSLDLATEDLDAVVDRIDEADGVVFASPVYRAAHTALLASLFERIPRGAAGETRAPLAGKAALVLLTGASHHHFLATERLRAPLASFFAAQTLSPGLYFTPASYSPDPSTPHKVLNDESRVLAELHGRALVELATAVRGGAALSRLTPLI
jgi:FMN reductase